MFNPAVFNPERPLLFPPNLGAATNRLQSLNAIFAADPVVLMLSSVQFGPIANFLLNQLFVL